MGVKGSQGVVVRGSDGVEDHEGDSLTFWYIQRGIGNVGARGGISEKKKERWRERQRISISA